MAHHVSFLLEQLAGIDYSRTPNRLALYADIKRRTRMRLSAQHHSHAEVDATIRNIDYAIGEIEENFDSYRAYFVDDGVFDGYRYDGDWRPESSGTPDPYDDYAEGRRPRRPREPGRLARSSLTVAVSILGLAMLGVAAAGALHLYRSVDDYAPAETAVSTNDSFGEFAVFFDSYKERLEEFRSRSRGNVYPISDKFISFEHLEGFVGRNLNSDFPLQGELAEIAGSLRYKSEDGSGFKLVAVNTGICSPLMLVRPELADPRRSNKPYDCTAFGIWTAAAADY